MFRLDEIEEKVIIGGGLYDKLHQYNIISTSLKISLRESQNSKVDFLCSRYQVRVKYNFRLSGR